VVAIGGTFIYLWQTGRLMRLKSYVEETIAELKKCNWPTWVELKGSTAVVTISLVLLGAFTVIVDYVFHTLVLIIT